MHQKNASPTREQRQIMERHGLKPRWWTVLRNLNHNLIVKNKLTGDVKYLEKQEVTMQYRQCPDCGAYLDPCERCDCHSKEKAASGGNDTESGKGN